MAKPESYSSFCFLTNEDMRKVGQLIAGIDEVLVQFKDEVNNGFSEAQIIKGRPIAPLRRNPMESGRLHDEAINRTAKQYLVQSDNYLLKKWDTCSVASDYLLDLCAKQEEVRAFLAMADAKMPAADAIHTRKLAEELPEGARDALDELYERMQEFTKIPVIKIHHGQVTRLAQLSTEMKRFAIEHAEFWKNAADRMDEDGQRYIQRFDEHEQKTSKTLDNIKTTMQVCMENVPDFYEMQTEYRRSMGNSREQG